MLLAVATIPLWSASAWLGAFRLRHPAQWVYLLVLAAAYGWLVRRVAAARRTAGGSAPGRHASRPGRLGGLAAFALLVLAVFQLCVPGDQIAALLPAGAGVLERPVAAGSRSPSSGARSVSGSGAS